ncbi:MAG: formylglycine-generating enzyme family protein [Spirochaetaceae bacterium]|jgi:formylglycine-generating enzyme required for sulfatase activity|nr:formylglycine-generating enzyme family protein [Spirochaetaceae bacterium]
MRKVVAGFVFMACVFAAYAQVRAAVFPFEVRDNVINQSEAQAFYGDFSNRFSRAGRETGLFSVVPRGDVEKLFTQEANFQLSRLSDSAKTAEYGRVLNAGWIISGQLSKVGTRIVFMISMYTYPDFVQIDGSQIYARDIDGLIDRIPGLVRDIQKSMTGGARPGAVPGGANPGAIPDGFVYIEGGAFIMGSPASEAGRDDDEAQHRVTVSPFYMGKCEVTQEEYEAVMGANPSKFKGYNLPVESVSWYDAVEYCNARSRKEGLTPAYGINGDNVTWNRNANGYRLPTEAEWEYACRVGTTTPFSTGNNITTRQANYREDRLRETTPAGSFPANPWGLYDMHGNVWEWCWDWYGGYPTSAQTNPTGAASGSDRVLRGGSWYHYAQSLRSAYRSHGSPSDRYNFLGFRLVRNGG